MNIIEGNLLGQGLKLALVVGRFNEFITGKLLDGAIDSLKRHGVEEENISISWCPGAFEIPLVAKKLAKTNEFDAIVCLGTVIRGSTPHFEYVSSQVAKGLAQVSLDTELPIIFGVLTTDTIEQAIERAGSKAGNKGFDAATTAIEMAKLIKNIN